ncbi:hypothetical protein DESC_880122 [Desulfosarcina cetonica]|nr:hypothetical protein DESC_880122 [Desulfosarcina cetonica]
MTASWPLGKAGGQGNVLGAGQPAAIHDHDCRSGAAGRIGHHHHRAIGVFGQGAGHVGAHGADIDFMMIHENPILRIDGDQEGGLVAGSRRGCGGAMHLDACLLDEGCGHQEENQQDEDHVDQRRHVDVGAALAITPCCGDVDHSQSPWTDRCSSLPRSSCRPR